MHGPRRSSFDGTRKGRVERDIDDEAIDPPHGGVLRKLADSLQILAAMVAMAACASVCAADIPSTRPAVKYLIPDGYVGWLRIDYGVSDSRAFQYGVNHILPLPIENGVVVAEFPPSGHLVTSSLMEDGWAKDEYYYSANGARNALSQAHDTGMVWNKANGSQHTFFFIGSSADYQKYGYRHDPQPRPGPIQR